ncbi:ADP-heptose:LPS heptosyltransferase II [bacterium BMS3Abin05]|nr:ADP-heptose:LPS heptosyltransferase II [bacterium BMS3Abin05]GBE26255.1 ADP-heptose:LPS heptosyltransferase II [bacterium BMS3Bbin03]
MIPIPDCKKFTGYKPCEPFKKCETCRTPVPVGTHILLINLDALGDVLVTTAVLPALRRKYPVSTIRWITRKNALPLLQNNPYLDEILVWKGDNRLILQNMRFDLALNADKNRNSSALIQTVYAGQKMGFGINAFGAIIPLNDQAEYNFRMGIDDQLKFYDNQRSGQAILAETFDLDYRRDEYVLQLTPEEEALSRAYRRQMGIGEKEPVLGINTGCSVRFPNKKLTLEQHIDLIKRISKKFPNVKIILLGGPEDTERNKIIKKAVGERARETPTAEGLRRGIVYENMADVVMTGDSLGMHIAIALKKWVIAWFGPTSPQEIDLYERGEKIITDVPCAPCWNTKCTTLECIFQMDLNRFTEAFGRFYQSQWKEGHDGRRAGA